MRNQKPSESGRVVLTATNTDQNQSPSLQGRQNLHTAQHHLNVMNEFMILCAKKEDVASNALPVQAGFAVSKVLICSK